MRNAPMIVRRKVDAAVIHTIKNGGVGIISTDTIYGIVGSALAKKTVQRVYKLRKRDAKKPMIVLIGSMRDLNTFGIKLNTIMKEQILKCWPGKVSIILPCPSKKFTYLHRGEKTIALRFPASARLRKLLKKTGPLVAPSANTEGNPPAQTIEEAWSYFGNGADFYIDGGRVASLPSTLVKIARDGSVKIMRNSRVEKDNPD